MGDRATIQVESSMAGTIYVYTHRGGYDAPQSAANAVAAARDRWHDHHYAMRIIVSELTRDGLGQSTGYGLSTSMISEDEYNGDQPSVIIDLDEGEIRTFGGHGQHSRKFDELTQASGV